MAKTDYFGIKLPSGKEIVVRPPSVEETAQLLAEMKNYSWPVSDKIGWLHDGNVVNRPVNIPHLRAFNFLLVKRYAHIRPFPAQTLNDQVHLYNEELERQGFKLRVVWHYDFSTRALTIQAVAGLILFSKN